MSNGGLSGDVWLLEAEEMHYKGNSNNNLEIK
jgi:hypothetical protein